MRQISNVMFSLVELMVVVVILGLLAGLATIFVAGALEKARVGTAQNDISTYQKGVDLFKINTGKYPSALTDLFTKPEGVNGWIKCINEPVKNDPWGNSFVLKVNPGDAENPFVIFSMGPDGQEGTGDDVYPANSQAEGAAGGGSGAPTLDNI